MTNLSEAELKALLAEGNVELIDEGASMGNPYIIGRAPAKNRTETAKPEHILVPDEHRVRQGVSFKSKTEYESMFYLLETYQPKSLLYEPVMFRLPSGNYTPDWEMWLVGQGLVYFEVKGTGGFKAYQSGRSSRKSLLEAAYHLTNRYGQFRLLMKVKGGGWKEEVI